MRLSVTIVLPLPGSGMAKWDANGHGDPRGWVGIVLLTSVANFIHHVVLHYTIVA